MLLKSFQGTQTDGSCALTPEMILVEHYRTKLSGFCKVTVHIVSLELVIPCYTYLVIHEDNIHDTFYVSQVRTVCF